MKEKNIRLTTYLAAFLTLGVAGATLSSCTAEVDDNFEQPASMRLKSVMDRAAQILQSAEYGWELEYYPGATLAYGGIVYTVSFDKQTATVGCSLIPDSTYTSYYKITNDNGPVLTFDTYNPLLHYFSTPSSGEYEAKGGEFEFVIDSLAEDFIALYGKKTRNTMYMRKLTATPNDYARKTVDIFDHFVDSIQGQIGTATVKGKCNPTNRSIALVAGRDTFDLHYTYNDRGIRFYRPLRVGGVSVQSFDFDIATNQLTCADEGLEAIKLEGIPYGDNFVSYPMYEGDYQLRYGTNSTVDVHLKPNRLEGTYVLQGLSPRYDLTLRYNPSTGNLALGSQFIGTQDGHEYYWVCYDYTDGYLSLEDEGQFTITWNKNRFYPAFNFSTTNPNVLNCNGGLLIYLYTNADGNLAAGIVDESSWLTNNSAQFRNLRSLNKKSRL